MRKILTLISISVLGISCLSLTGCKEQASLKNTFFSDEVLSKYKLEGLPKANLENSRITDSYDTLYLNISLEEYASYSKDVYEFITNKIDLYYQGYIFGSHLVAEMILAYDVTDVYSKYDYKKDLNGFSYSTENVEMNENEVNAYVELKNSKQVFIERISDELRDGFKYNTKMYFQSRTSSFQKCGVEHTYKESKELPIAGTTETRKVYSCDYCNDVKIETTKNDYADTNTYKINVCKGKEFLKNNLLEKTYSSVIINIETYIITDVNIVVKANGTIIPLDYCNSDSNVFSFIMPHKDVNIEITIEGALDGAANGFMIGTITVGSIWCC